MLGATCQPLHLINELELGSSRYNLWPHACKTYAHGVGCYLLLVEFLKLAALRLNW